MEHTDITAFLEGLGDTLLRWATTPAGWVQAAIIIAAIVAAPLLARALRRRFAWFRTPPGPDAVFQGLAFKVAPFLRALILVGLLAAGSATMDAAFGQSVLMRTALGLALVFLLYRMIRTLLPASVHRAAYLVAIPVALLAVVGVLGDITSWLDTNYALNFLGTTFTPTKILRILLLGALFVWLGGVFNTRGQTAIRQQERLDIGVREIMAKIFQIGLFIALALMLLSVASIPLSGLVVVISAVGLGLIILLDRSVRIGDFIQMDDGMAGTVGAINMRSTTLETADGKDLIIPNLAFIKSRYENWTHSGPCPALRSRICRPLRHRPRQPGGHPHPRHPAIRQASDRTGTP